MIYLDNAATTQPKFFSKDYSQMWFNSNTNYAFTEQRMLEGARETIKDCLGVKTGEVLFCRCATEAVEWLVKSFPYLNYVGCCSKYEHNSVYDLFYSHNNITEYIKNKNKYYYYLHQYVNQLTGTIFDIESIGKQVQANGAYFGSDFTAAIGHTPIPSNLDTFCDAVWFSGHKFGCEKGIGAIWISDRLFELFGGDTDPKNQYSLMHGTVNVAGALAMADAMRHAVEMSKTCYNKYPKLFMQLDMKLNEYGITHRYVDDRSGNYTLAINSIIFPGINADALQVYLASKGIYVSIGASACADTEDRYRVLKSFGLTNEECESTIRVSFSEDTIYDGIDNLVREIKNFKEMF